MNIKNKITHLLLSGIIFSIPFTASAEFNIETKELKVEEVALETQTEKNKDVIIAKIKDSFQKQDIQVYDKTTLKRKIKKLKKYHKHLLSLYNQDLTNLKLLEDISTNSQELSYLYSLQNSFHKKDTKL